MSTMILTPADVRTRTARPTPPASVRLTRRGRFAVLALALVTVLVVGLFLAAGSVATEHPGTPEPTRVVMVGSGDTLWDIAADIAGSGDVVAMVDRIEELNALDTGMVAAGQRLRVPLH
ncbi:LysM peptidoglycan-binding domain-containing protein [Nocardioides sp.]|uniref:LysM peptidoglycan-binding domain-containing protein n=1 Tax=Nocardioides sp. TaxID=35761 RepID=UPI0031FF205C|nr:Peptidoglycan-binding LysM [Nocardioides sp.]